ncbi:MAG: NUDIX hydrolase [Patescibacteria group bacterium]|nr:NUDIX hydrolase [Patescibacteria group bacterium]
MFEDSKKTVFLRHVVVDMLVLNKNNQILLVKRAPRLTRGNKYTVPGGYLNRDENLVEGALREFKEETGFDGRILHLFMINDNPNRRKEDRQNVCFVFIAEVISGEKKLNDEVTEIKWFDLENIPGEDAFAFDHREMIELYFEYLKKPFELPILGFNKKI